MKKIILGLIVLNLLFGALNGISISAEQQVKFEKKYLCNNLYEAFGFNKENYNKELSTENIEKVFNDDNSVTLKIKDNVNSIKLYFNVDNPKILGGAQNSLNDYHIPIKYKLFYNVSTDTKDFVIKMNFYNKDGESLLEKRLNSLQLSNEFLLTAIEQNYSEAKYVCIEILSHGIDLSNSDITIRPIKCWYAFEDHNIITVGRVESTCTTPGSYGQEYCTVCQEYLTVGGAMAPLPHKEIVDKGFPATCIKNGLTDGIHCVDCNKIIKAQKVIKATGHKVVIQKKKGATYFKNGYTGDKICTVCHKLIKKGKTIPKKVLLKPVVKINTGKKKIIVKYSKVKNASGYQIQYKPAKGKLTIKTYKSSKAAVTKIENLKSNRKYYIRVRSFLKQNGKTTYGKWSKFKTVKTF